LTGVLTAAYKKPLTILNGLTGTKQGIYNNGFAMVPLSPTKFSLTDYRVTVISSGIENAKLLKIQALAAEFVKAQAIDPDVLVGIMNKKSVHEVENILKVALAAKKEEMASIQKMQQALDQAQEEFLSYKLR
jgi:enterochelin esterase-like enzyme